jgi:hypothetical protein
VEAIVCFLFPKIGGSCDFWWENKRAGVSFFKKNLEAGFGKAA